MDATNRGAKWNECARYFQSQPSSILSSAYAPPADDTEAGTPVAAEVRNVETVQLATLPGSCNTQREPTSSPGTFAATPVASQASDTGTDIGNENPVRFMTESRSDCPGLSGAAFAAVPEPIIVARHKGEKSALAAPRTAVRLRASRIDRTDDTIGDSRASASRADALIARMLEVLRLRAVFEKTQSGPGKIFFSGKTSKLYSGHCKKSIGR